MQRVIIALVVSVAVLLWVFWALARWLFLRSDTDAMKELAAWGGSFGGLSALISAAGFIAVVISFQKQQADQHRQRFYSNFIEMLKLVREARNDVRFRYGTAYLLHYSMKDEPQEGLRAFRAAWKEIEFYLQPTDDREAIRTLYIDRVHERYEGNLGPYFRLLYTILNNIRDDRLLSKREKEIYGNLLRGQLTSFELVIVSLNALDPDIAKDMWSLLVEFRVPRYIPEGVRKAVLAKCYPPEVFERRS